MLLTTNTSRNKMSIKKSIPTFLKRNVTIFKVRISYKWNLNRAIGERKAIFSNNKLLANYEMMRLIQPDTK